MPRTYIAMHIDGDEEILPPFVHARDGEPRCHIQLALNVDLYGTPDVVRAYLKKQLEALNEAEQRFNAITVPTVTRANYSDFVFGDGVSRG